MKKLLCLLMTAVLLLSTVVVTFHAAEVDRVDQGANVDLSETGNPYPAYNYYNSANDYQISCTWYAWNYANNAGHPLPDVSWGNAGSWYGNASNKGTSPATNSIACWSFSNSPPYGHVAYVTGVNSDGSINIVEGGSNWPQADSHGICITTSNGTIVTTGDFKFDLTPIGTMADLHKMASIGAHGATLLLSDSTNALSEGFSKSESRVDVALYEILKSSKSRVIIATFASNIYRLKHIVDNCKKTGRKIATFGRSMDNNIEISIQGGYIKHKDIFVTPEEANHMPPEKVCILCTGTQGEPLAALSRIAEGTHKQIKLMPDDVVVFSSSAIPGNAINISRTINKLYMKGVKVYTNTSLSDVHTSGHANEEELKLMIRLIKPKYVMPFHGEYRMLKKHADIAQLCGIPKENTFILQNGDVLSMYKGEIKRAGTVEAGDTYVDGNRIGSTGSIVMKDRKIMANDGIIVVIANINMKNKELLGKVNITTRGFVQVNENEELLHELENLSKKAILNKINNQIGFGEIKSEIVSVLSNYTYEKTGRRPIILPVIMDIKK